MEKVSHRAIKYPSTGQFRNAIHNLRTALTFEGLDSQGQAIYNQVKDLPIIELIGTVKVHGTNGSLVMFEDQSIYCQSKERALAFGCDNAGFWEAMQAVDKVKLFQDVKDTYQRLNGKEIEYPVIITGEWAGKGIQKGVAVSDVAKFFMVFGIKVADKWQPSEDYTHIKSPEDRIFNAFDFETYHIKLDLNSPQYIQNELIRITEQVEQECPVGKQLGSLGIGEGVVWKPAKEFSDNSGYWFKVKGEKHSSSKVKKLASVDAEKLSSVKEFIDYAVTESRLEQGATEVGLDITKVGAFIGWMNKDIYKEEADTLRASGLEMKDVGKAIADKSRKFYLNKI